MKLDPESAEMPEPFSALKTTLLVSAVTGGAVAALIGGGSWFVRITRGVVGAACSFYLTPIVAPGLELFMERLMRLFLSTPINLDSEGVFGATGFMLGVVGMIVVECFRDMARKIREKMPGTVGDKIDRL